MKSTFALVMAAVAAGQSIPPAEFNLPVARNNTQLGVAFQQMTGDTVVVQPGVLFGKQITSTQPNIGINVKASQTLSKLADASSPLLLVMIDPDAPSPDAPSAANILHWMAPDLSAKTAAQDFGPLQGQAVLTNSTPNVVPFAPPGPPATSSAHRYLLFLFEQPEGFTVPAQFAQFNAMNRANFDFNAFIAAAALADPVAVNFMYVSGQDAVPVDFQGAALSEFPGGNGNAIGLPGSTAVSNGTQSVTPPAAAPPVAAPPAAGSGAAGGLISATPGQPAMGMGVLSTDGSCTCNVACPAGSFPMVMVSN